MNKNQMVNQVVDQVMRTRHSVRVFDKRMPEKSQIEAVLEAGRLAPYAGLANKDSDDFRRFFVIPTQSKIAEKIRKACFETLLVKLDMFEKAPDPRMEMMLKVMHIIKEKGLPEWKAPYLIIIAERKGFPSREESALGYCLENMWLKATALGIGLQIVSAITDLNQGPVLSSILGLKEDEFIFDACQIGYPLEALEDKLRPEPKLLVEWM